MIAVKSRFPMGRYWVALVLIVLFMIAPLAVAIISGNIAAGFGCRVDEGSAHPCMIGGSDWGDTFYALGVAGWLFLFTIPLGLVALAVWVIVKELHRRSWVNRHGPG